MLTEQRIAISQTGEEIPKTFISFRSFVCNRRTKADTFDIPTLRISICVIFFNSKGALTGYQHVLRISGGNFNCCIFVGRLVNFDFQNYRTIRELTNNVVVTNSFITIAQLVEFLLCCILTVFVVPINNKVKLISIRLHSRVGARANVDIFVTISCNRKRFTCQHAFLESRFSVIFCSCCLFRSRSGV